MNEMTVGVRDLKARLSEYLRQVRRGQTIVITDHGQPVGRIMPVEQPLEERIHFMQEAGLLAWNGQTLPPFKTPFINQSGKLISDLIVEMREADE